ncbi:hypothetical protein F511_39701 [Dorcoceras hygrometricum]|uniref:Uncharacterized protein n=1 Tax=Dorcoceras hygrometricum TaxID=472368 RepID=A0A2Z7BH32_9LAMI|nr:hypothetical protein F511_39701 [Dorcoceras hygrometricum]
MNIAESPAIDKHPHTTADSDSSSLLPQNRLTCTKKANVNEIGLVNSAVNGITVEQQQMPTGNSAAGINQMSTNWVWSTRLLMKHSEQLTLRKYHMNSEQLTLRKYHMNSEQLTLRKYHMNSEQLTLRKYHMNSEQLTLRKYHMNSEQLTLRKYHMNSEQLTLRKYHMNSEQLTLVNSVFNDF